MIDLQTITQSPDYSDVKTSVLKRAHEYAARVSLGWWIKRRLDARFNGSVGTELGWSPRKTRSKRRFNKRAGKRAFDHNWTGNTYRTVKRNTTIKTVSRRDGTQTMRILMRNLPDQYKINYRSGRVKFNSELGRITREEARVITDRYAQAFAEYINHDPKARPKKKKHITT